MKNLIAKNETALPAKNKGKGTPAKNAAPATPAKKAVAAKVFLDLPKGTERFTSASGIDWIRTPKHGAFQRWFNMTRGTHETGIHAAKKNADGTYTLTIERARLPHRRDGEKNVGTIREM